MKKTKQNKTKTGEKGIALPQNKGLCFVNFFQDILILRLARVTSRIQ